MFAEDIADLATVQRPALSLEPQLNASSTLVVSGVYETASPSSPTTAPEPEEIEHKAKLDRLAKHGLPIQRLAGDLADAWERWSNALSPTAPPMHPCAARRRLALHIAPVAAVLACMPAALILQGCSLVVGILFFTDPLVAPAIAFLDSRNSDWRQELEIRK